MHAYRRILAPLLVMALLASACAGASGDDTTTTTPGTTDDPTTTTSLPEDTTTTTLPPDGNGFAVLASDAPREASSASAGDVATVVAGLEALAADLYGILSRQDGNLVFSPASITLALAMTYAGARGVTAEEMAAALHYDLPQEGLHAAFNALDALLESRNREEMEDVGGIEMAIANSLWGQQGFAFEDTFLDTLARNYGAGLRLVDFGTATEAARTAINAWVAAATNDKIMDLIPAGVLDAMTRLVLVNAVYLDATWAYQFDPDLTTEDPFHLLDGTTVTVPTMHQGESLAYASGPGWQAVAMPYVGVELAMLLLVPDEGRFDEIETAVGDGLLSSAAASVVPAHVRLDVPKFEFRSKAELAAVLGELGMEQAFDPSRADFSGMAAEPLYISDVIHEAYIAVDEEGTEAAAATAVVMRATSAPMEPVDLTIDRPFLFMLYDRETGTPLFLGRVLDPTA